MPITPSSFASGDRVVVEHPHQGRCWGTVVGPAEYAEPAFMVQIDGGYIQPWMVLASWMSVPLGQRDMEVGDLLDLDVLKKGIEVEFLGGLWVDGDSGLLTPHVCRVSFGNGLKLLKIFTINQRPNFHVVRIDSGWGDDDIAEAMDTIVTEIEMECGSARPMCPDKDAEVYAEDEHGDPLPKGVWPAIDDRNGCSWANLGWKQFFEPAPPPPLALAA